MADLLQRAIDNNVGVYRAVLGRLGIEMQVRPDIAHTDAKVPAYYSNAVTRSDRWRPDEGFHRIAAIARKEGWADWSIKDSHDVLNLGPHGFERLFRATWIHLDPARLRPFDRSLRFEVVRDEDGLSRWRRAWDANLPLGRTLFGAELLRDPDLYFVAGYDGGRLVCGGLFNRTNDVLGISNFFARDEAKECWAAAVSHILDRLRPSVLVGYAGEAALVGFEAIGFKAIGTLSVWHWTANPGRPA